jgi:hypothetical protein
MKKFLAILIIVFVNGTVFCQSFENGIPGFRNYSPKDYGQESQNFSVIQDKNGLMFFGNANGIMEFDNTNWQLVKITGRPILSVNSKNEIYFGGYNQAGKLVYKNGLPQAKFFNFHEEFKPGQIKKVIATDDEVFMTSSHQLFVYKDDSIELEQSNANGIDIFKLSDKILIFIPERGLYYWDKGTISPYTDSNLFENLKINDIIQLNSKDFLIKEYDKPGFLKYSGGKLSVFNTEADEFINSNSYSCSVWLDKERLSIGTQHGGIVCIDNKGHFLFSLNRDSGLRDNQTTGLHFSRDGILWITTYN